MATEEYKLFEDTAELKPSKILLIKVLIVAMSLIALFIVFFDSIVVQVPSGHRGVIFRPLSGGTVLNEVKDEGYNLIYPWNKVILYDTRIIQEEDTIIALTLDGLPVQAIISYRFRVEKDSIGFIHKAIGPDYSEKIIIPKVTAATRDIISLYRVDDLFTISRNKIQIEMTERVDDNIEDLYPIIMDDVVIREILLEEKVKQAIAEKLVKEQEMLSHDYVIEKERKEKTRRQIEAEGIRDFEAISGLNILKWRGIEATQNLAESNNSKVIIIGSGEDELPIILGSN